LFYSHEIPQVEFAASEIRAVPQAKGIKCATFDLGIFSQATQTKDGEHTPFIERRGIKFNIPLDARTLSYSDAGDAAQQNIPEMWSMDFWREFLDEMARDHYDVLSLWNLSQLLVQILFIPSLAAFIPFAVTRI